MSQASPRARVPFALAIHGGAGVINRKTMSPELERDFRAALTDALTAGHDVLAAGGTSLDAVVAAVVVMEDSPLFNAGRGAAFTSDGTNELDASVMDGATLEAGAVAIVTTVKNPVRAARLVMERTPHVMLAGAAAEAFARENGCETADPSYFFTQHRWDAMQRLKAAAGAGGVGAASEADKHGTVGAVALDSRGNLAAATSTGGRTNKMAGRVGDTPVIGAGTYANNATAAVSCTGEGEYFMRTLAAYNVSALMQFGGHGLGAAAETTVREHLAAVGGRGGLIAVDRSGNIALPFSTPGMYRGAIRAGGEPAVSIYQNG